MENIYFLTSNIQKASYVASFGVKVKKFEVDIPEVLSDQVEVVVLYKAKSCGLDNILVEDTSLDVEDAHFLGTEIKHVYEEIKDDASFHGKKAVWRVSMCVRQGDSYYVATGELSGHLCYPALDYGYHFNKIFKVSVGGSERFFEELSEEEKNTYGPRFLALKKLQKAFATKDYAEISVLPASLVPEWTGEYQVEKKAVKYAKL